MTDPDPIDFEMTDLVARPGPCRKAAAEETDATAARLERGQAASRFVAEATCSCGRLERTCDKRRIACRMSAAEVDAERAAMRALRGWACDRAVEVRYGSGKVKV